MANKKNKRVSKNKKKQLNKKKPSLGEQKLSKKDRDVINLMEDVDTTGVVRGTVKEGCEAVKDEFTKFFRKNLDRSSQLAVYVGDELIIDLYGDTMGDEAPYDADSLQMIFSSGKSVASILMGILFEEGLVDYDAPVTDYWEEFG